MKRGKISHQRRFAARILAAVKNSSRTSVDWMTAFHQNHRISIPIVFVDCQKWLRRVTVCTLFYSTSLNYILVSNIFKYHNRITKKHTLWRFFFKLTLSLPELFNVFWWDTDEILLNLMRNHTWIKKQSYFVSTFHTSMCQTKLNIIYQNSQFHYIKFSLTFSLISILTKNHE